MRRPNTSLREHPWGRDPSVMLNPEPTATDLFILHEGSYGYRKESRNGYYRIVLEDGKIGWLPEGDVMEAQ